MQVMKSWLKIQLATLVFGIVFFAKRSFFSFMISTVVSCLFVWPEHWACVLLNKTHFTAFNMLNYLNYALASAKYLRFEL